MKMNQKIQDRKKYVDSIREAFHEQPAEEVEEYGDFVESPVSFYFQIRLFLAICIFLAFAAFDHLGGEIYSYSSQDIVSAMEKNVFQEEYDTVVSGVTGLFSRSTKND